MAKQKRYAVLNVVAQPHPPGIYREIFEEAGRNQKGVNFFGDSFARIDPPSRSVDGIFRGRLAVWTEIDESEPIIFKTSLEQTMLDATDILVPTEVGFNSKIFYYAFREIDHLLFVEAENDYGNSISPSRAHAAFSKILESVRLDGVDDVSVHIKTQKSTVERILAIPRIRKIEIVVNVPNPDDLHDDVQAVFDEINGMHAKRLSTEITRAPGQESVVLSQRYRILAEVAKDNGHFTAEGTDLDGDRVQRSSKEFAEVIDATLEDGETEYRKVADIARDYGNE